MEDGKLPASGGRGVCCRGDLTLGRGVGGRGQPMLCLRVGRGARGLWASSDSPGRAARGARLNAARRTRA